MAKKNRCRKIFFAFLIKTLYSFYQENKKISVIYTLSAFDHYYSYVNAYHDVLSCC